MDLNKEWYHNEFMNQEILTPHRLMEEELTFYTAIANGDIDYVKKVCEESPFSKFYEMEHLSKNPLQNLRYHFVITTAMLTRYCVHAGMEQEKAYNLSNFYILKMDDYQKTSEIAELHDIMSMDFCKQMNQMRNKRVLSKPIVLCINYIYSHIHYRITIKEVANYLSLSPSYVSKLFHKEMGVSLSQYIVDLKIEKAKNLLQFSDYSILQIANYLSFSSQSHFIQVFQKKTGLTPHKYRTWNFRASW